MSEPTSPDIKISKNPVIQEKVDQEVIGLHEKDPNASLSTINRQARDRVAAGIKLERLRKELTESKKESTIDHLTKLPNLKWFYEMLKINKSKAERALRESAQKGFFLIIFDVDNFKSVNDKHGHLAGDKVLRTIAQLKKRAEEPIARIGGDEFAQIINGGMDEENIGKLIERYRENFGELTKEAGFPSLTLSFGIAQYKSGLTEIQWMELADQALYAAKNAGRDKVYIADAIIDGKAKTRELTIA